jgi:hypothetical protein
LQPFNPENTELEKSDRRCWKVRETFPLSAKLASELSAGEVKQAWTCDASIPGFPVTCVGLHLCGQKYLDLGFEYQISRL